MLDIQPEQHEIDDSSSRERKTKEQNDLSKL